MLLPVRMTRCGSAQGCAASTSSSSASVSRCAWRRPSRDACAAPTRRSRLPRARRQQRDPAACRARARGGPGALLCVVAGAAVAAAALARAVQEEHQRRWRRAVGGHGEQVRQATGGAKRARFLLLNLWRASAERRSRADSKAASRASRAVVGAGEEGNGGWRATSADNVRATAVNAAFPARCPCALLAASEKRAARSRGTSRTAYGCSRQISSPR
jgi:hypothetical protein